MGEYKSLYEKYYSGMRNKSPGRVPGRSNSLYGYSSRGGGPSRNRGKTGKSLANMFIYQLLGAFILLAGMLVLKYLPIEGANEAYTMSREAVEKNISMEEVKAVLNINSLEGYREGLLDWIDEVKSNFTGEKTIKEVLKEEFLCPLQGEYTNLTGENIGVIISVKEEKEVIASYEGTVKEVKEDESGVHILIDNGNGIETYYGLLSTTLVSDGDKIKKGDIIGKSGVVDSSNNNGIIFKLMYMGQEKNPLEYMDFSTSENI